MGELALAGVLFIGAHLGVSSTPLRASLVRAVGDRAYLGLYSLLAAVTLGFLIFAYGRASHADFLWLPTPALRAVPFVLMPIAFTFLLGGFMTRNPTAVGQEATVTQVGQGAGLVRITRHPFQWSVVLWAIGHIVANGDVASLLFFGSLGALSLWGSFLIDAKKARTMGADWTAFSVATSNVPFLAIAQSRNRLVPGELALPLLIGFVAYALVLWGHRFVSGGVSII
ncbi:MAG TPA: NnrU family protein [Pseudomonadales bacterium]|jgi:uncharacterized membrane protein|nr:NnrU family protein [Pseudomonadales bacterium]